ncbi:MAG TPA: hypothetical protein VGK73_15385, partial [Polyangiaceae bacterium]
MPLPSRTLTLSLARGHPRVHDERPQVSAHHCSKPAHERQLCVVPNIPFPSYLLQFKGLRPPYFQQALPMSLDLNPLRKTRVIRGQEHESVRPCLSLVLYTGQPLSKLGPAGAAALRIYLEAIPKDALKSCEMGDDTGPLTSRRIARDIKRLEKPAKNDDFFALVYSSSED